MENYGFSLLREAFYIQERKIKKKVVWMNEENLIPNNKRSKSEVRENSRKGGINSGKKRKKLKSFREAITELLLLPPPEREDLEKLKTFGIEETNQMLAVVAFFEGITGKNKMNAEIYKLFLEILGENKQNTETSNDTLKSLIEVLKGG